MNKNLLAAIVLSGVAVLFFLFVMPRFDELSAARKTLANRTQLLADVQAAQTNLSTLNKEYAAQEASIQKILLALPARRQLDYVTSSLQNIAAQSGLQLKALTIDDTAKTTAEYQSFRIRVELTGTYVGLLQFLSNVEQSVRLYDVTKIDVAEQGGGGRVLSISLDLVTYSLQ